MSSSVSSRRVAALAVAASGLATILSGAFAPAATAAPTTATTTSAETTVAAARSSWFVDPRTPAQRRAQVAVPRKPDAYRGRVRETRAVYRTRAGALAVPMRFAFGHQVAKGQALTLDGRGLFSAGSNTLTTPAKAQLRRLADSLDNASKVRCEGYADYSGPASKARSLARSRAATVCQRLAAANPGLRTSSVGYGSRRPAVVGGTPRQRQLNRRVVVEMTGTRPTPVTPLVPPVPPVPPVPQPQVPGAPVLDHVTGVDHGVYYGFAVPAGDGGSPITGYQVTTGDGWEAVQPLLGRSAATACRGACGEDLIYASLTGLTPETTVDLRVRALNEVGAGAPSNTLSATVFGRPSAPTNLTVVGDDGTLAATFGAPEHDGGSEVDSYEISYDDGEHWSPADIGSSAPYTVTKTGLDNGTTYDVRVRATNRWGTGPSASASALVATVPGAPSLDQPELDGTSAWVVFGRPEYDGGTAIISYELSTDGGETWRPFLFTDIEPFVYATTVTGLSYGESYDVQVRAFNARGRGPASTTRTVAPVTVPDVPTDVVATASGSTVTITFEAPSFHGGSEITGYQVKVDDGDWAAAVLDGNQIVLSGQTWGAHVYQVRAVNVVGASPSATSNQVVLTEPSPTAYRSEYYYSGGQVLTYVYYTTVPGALRYEAQLDGGDWLPISVEADWGREQMGRAADPVCVATACTGNRTIRVRAVTAAGPGNPGNSFPVTYYILG